MMEIYKQVLMEYATSLTAHSANGESILELLYDAYSQEHFIGKEQLQADFRVLYGAMNGMSLKEIDRVINPVCALCYDHEKFGFMEGVKVGLLLFGEIGM